MKQSRLKMYVMSFDGETLQRYATIRSREAVEIVITPQGIDSSKDEHIQISFKGLKRLVLEAVTFGSFLWDVESCRFKVSLSLCVLRVYRLINHCMRSSFTLCVWFVQLQRRSFGQGRRRVNKRTSLAQKEDVIKRTVYVKGIDQQRAFDEGCRGVIAKTGWTSFSQAAQIMEEQENDRNRSVMVQSTTDLDLRRLFLNATSGSNIFFDKETNAGENIDCGNIFK
uniref:Uncharacterized protein n=1 Tax=Brassica oleracea TaxID=3712 RepID=A0A3P6CUP2_BRAOL|nr:unnamed protein product [Brassica oleracea]